MKIYDAGQWLRAKSGVKFSRKWRKLHLAIDAETLTDQNTSDISRFQICLDRLNSRLPVSGAIVLITVIEFTKLYAAITPVWASSHRHAIESCKMHHTAVQISAIGIVTRLQWVAGDHREWNVITITQIRQTENWNQTWLWHTQPHASNATPKIRPCNGLTT